MCGLGCLFSGKYSSSRFKHYFYIDTPTILPLTFAANKAGQTLPPSLGFIVIKCHSNFLWLLYWSNLIIRKWLTLGHRISLWLGAVCVRVRTFAQALFVITVHIKSWTSSLSELSGHNTWREWSWGSLPKICSAAVPSLRLCVHVLLLNLLGRRWTPGHVAPPEHVLPTSWVSLEETRTLSCVSSCIVLPGTVHHS